jgi:hypothetical protein
MVLEMGRRPIAVLKKYLSEASKTAVTQAEFGSRPPLQ